MLRNLLARAMVGYLGVMAWAALAGQAGAVEGGAAPTPSSTTISTPVKPAAISISTSEPTKSAATVTTPKPVAVKSASRPAKSVAKAAHHEPLPEFLLPQNTKGFLAVTNITDLNAQWNKTQLGQLMADPVMQPFSKDLNRQLQNRMAHLEDRLGLTMDDLREIPSGELTVALIQPKEGDEALATVMDATGRLDKAQAMIAKATKRLLERGAKQSSTEIAGTAVLAFDAPPPADDPDSHRRHTAYFIRQNYFGVADSPAVVEFILRHMAGESGKTLGTLKGFQEVMARCQKDAGDMVPNVRWWVEPIGYAEASRAVQREENRRKGKTIFEVMRHQGFEAMQGVGGYVNFKVQGHEILHRTAAYAPPPYQNSMKMLVFPNQKEYTPQSWVPREIGTYATFYCDVLNAFDNFGPLYEELLAEGEKGAWDDVLNALKVDPTGPKIDLRKELIMNLNNRVTLLSDYELPITVHSERLLYAIETKDEKAVTRAMAKWMGNDPTVKRRVWKPEGHDKSYVIWEAVEEEAEMPTVAVEAVPSLNPNESQTKRILGRQPPGGANGNQPVLPHAAVTVAFGQLLIASHIDFLKKILVPPAKQRDLLVKDIDFNLVQKSLDALGLPERFVRSFSRTDEECRPNYELLRQGKMGQSETMFAKALNVLFGTNRRGSVRQQKIDGRQLPDYDVVRRYLGPAGMTAVSEPHGWFIKGFLPPKLSQ